MSEHSFTFQRWQQYGKEVDDGRMNSITVTRLKCSCGFIRGPVESLTLNEVNDIYRAHLDEVAEQAPPLEMDPQPVPGQPTILVDRAWFDAAMERGVPFRP